METVITTKFVMHQNSPVLNVYRDVEGDWQFLSNDDASESDAIIVSLDNILKHDPTLKEIVKEINPGFSAHRSQPNAGWEIRKFDF